MWINRITLWFYKYLLVIIFPSMKNKPTHCLSALVHLSLSLNLSFSMEGDYFELSQFPYNSRQFLYNSYPF